MGSGAREGQVFIGGLDPQIPAEDLEALLFELLVQCGGGESSVLDIRIPRSTADDGSTRGFAFAELDSAEAATYATLALNGMRLFGRPMRVACAMADEASRQVRLGNLPLDVSEPDLYFALSERLPTVRGVCIHRVGGGGGGGGRGGGGGEPRSEGRATVWLDSAESAHQASEVLQENALYFNSVPVYVD